MSRASNLIPGGKPHHREVRRFKIDRLPPHARTVIFDGFARGDTFRQIVADLAKIGHRVGHSSVSRYWREVWSAAHDRLRFARAGVAALKQALLLDPNSPTAQLAEEMLYTFVFQKQKLEDIEKKPPLDLLHQAREQRKVELASRSRRSQAAAGRPGSLKQHLDQLYGPGVVVEEEVDGSDPDNETR